MYNQRSEGLNQGGVNFFHQNDVEKLDIGSLSKFYRRQKVWLILFFDPNEQESQDFKEVWDKIAGKMYGIVTFAGVNCDADEEICDDFEAYGYPKIYAAHANIDEDYVRYDG